MTIDTIAAYILLFGSLYFEVFLLLAFIQLRLSRRAAKPEILPPYFPSVAIVVPCFNESTGIARTLNSLLALRYPSDKLDIFVVDDGSTDNTFDIARRFEADPRVHVYRKHNGGKHSAMNFALGRTNAELIGCLDADSIVAPSALERLAPLFRDKKIAAVTPGIHVLEPKTFLQKMQHVEYRLSIFNRFMLAVLGAVFITPGPFSFFRTSVVRELGGWRYAHSTEDMEMALRIQQSGHLIANAPQAIVHTSTPATLRALFRQRVRWTYGWLRNAVDYRHMIGNRAYGNLGVIVLPFALISIGTGIFFFVRILFSAASTVMNEYVRFQAAGLPQPSSLAIDPFYLPTSVFLFLVWVSVALILILIMAGSFIGTGSRRPPAATPLFLIFYSFLAPLWLCAAVVRALFKTGVRWR